MATLQATRITGSTAGTSNGLEVVRPNSGGGPPGNFTYTSNDIAFRNKYGESYFNNAPTEAYFYSQNLPVTIYASAQPALYVTGPVTSGRVGVGASPDVNGRLYVYGEGNTSNFLSIANCNGIATISSAGRSLAGYVRIYIASSVSNGGVNAFGNTTYYLAVYS